MPDDAHFIFTTCQVGAEWALKREFARRWPECHAAFSRPGFVTFKVVAPEGAPDMHTYDAIFARAWGHSLGKVGGASKPALSSTEGRTVSLSEEPVLSSIERPSLSPIEGQAEDRKELVTPERDESKQLITAEHGGYRDMVRQVWELAGDRKYTGLHVWHRDACEAGDHGYEPDLLPEDKEIAGLLRAARHDLTLPAWVNEGAMVLDVVIVEPDLWWVGWHEATSPTTCWPGGFAKIALPDHAVARTYLKMEEALRWANFPLRPGQQCAEIGSAPGGASQALLAHGLVVTGIDPAEMHPLVLAHSNFRHIRKRGHEVRRREFRKTKWLTADINMPPAYTLDTVEGIVMHPEVSVRGLLLTLKLPQWDLADEIPTYLFRIRTWGFHDIRARQLQHNRREFTVAALRA